MNEQVEFEYKEEQFKGLLIKEEGDLLTIKLSSGYNASFPLSDISSLVRKANSSAKVLVSEVPASKDKKLPKVSILHTGGTIASKVDYATGAVISKFDSKELLALFPELHGLARIDAKMIGNLMSEDLNFFHYNGLIKAIAKEIESGADAIIISHGTDTMHYSSAALQYALHNLPIPVLLVGAQRSSDRASSDAYSNLSAALQFIGDQYGNENAYRRVGICMHAGKSDDSFNIVDGINAKKMHSSRRDAFKQINFPPVAKITLSGPIEYTRDLKTSLPKEPFSYDLFNPELCIGFFKVHPHLQKKELESLSLYDAVIIEATGLGHVGVSHFDDYTKTHPEFLDVFKNLVENGTKLVVGVQTVYGQTNMNVYTPGRRLLATGVKGQGMNLTTETLFARTSYLLSTDKEHFDEAWEKNLEGFELESLDLD